jgi:hypothetical protein
MLPIVSDTAMNLLNDSAQQILAELAKRDEHYAIEDINGVLARWLELSIEQICSDALYHCVLGDRSYALNQKGFADLLKKVNTLVEFEAEAAQELKDHAALVCERVS